MQCRTSQMKGILCTSRLEEVMIDELCKSRRRIANDVENKKAIHSASQPDLKLTATSDTSTLQIEREKKRKKMQKNDSSGDERW